MGMKWARVSLIAGLILAFLVDSQASFVCSSDQNNPHVVIATTTEPAFVEMGGEEADDRLLPALGSEPRVCWIRVEARVVENDLQFTFGTFDLAPDDKFDFLEARGRPVPRIKKFQDEAQMDASYSDDSPPDEGEWLLSHGPALLKYTYAGKATTEKGLTMFAQSQGVSTTPGAGPADGPDASGDPITGTPLPGPTTPADSGGSGSSNLWAILGPVIGILIVLVVIVILFIVYMNKQSKREAALRRDMDPPQLASHKSRRITVDDSLVRNVSALKAGPHDQSADLTSQYPSQRAVSPQPAPHSNPGAGGGGHRHLRRLSNQTLDETVGSLFGGTPLPPVSNSQGGGAAAGNSLGVHDSRASAGSAPRSSVGGIDIPAEDVQVFEEIGRGSFGSVFAGNYRGTDVAVKTVPVSDESTRAAFERETTIMAGVRHPNCVMMMGLISELPDKPNMAGLVMEKAMCTVHDVIMSRKLDHATATQLAMGIAKGIAYLHARHIVHRDLKSQNVLLDHQGVPKVSDFGLSKIAEASAMSTSVGTPYTMAPEVIKHEPYDASADVYSFAIVLWQLFTSQLPYKDLNAAQVVFQVAVAGVRPDIPDDVPNEIAAMIRQGWDPDPSVRPSMEEVIARLQSFQASLPQYDSAHPPGSIAPSSSNLAPSAHSGGHIASVLLSMQTTQSPSPNTSQGVAGSSSSKGPLADARLQEANPDDSSTW